MQLTDIIASSKNNNYQASGNVALLTLDIAKAISKACKFVSKDKNELRPELSHVCFHFKYDTLTIVATNSEWAYISEPFNIGQLKTFPDHKYLVTVEEARSIAKVIRANKTMYLQTGYLKFFVGQKGREYDYLPCINVCKGSYELLCCRKSEISYPDYERYIPEYQNTFTTDTFRLKSIVNEMVMKFEHGGKKYNNLDNGSIPKHNHISGEVTGSKNYPIALICEPCGYTIAIGIKGMVVCQRQVKIIDSTGERIWALYFNAKLVQEILKLIPDTVNTFVATTGRKDNGIVIAPEGSQERYLLMPLQL